MSRSLHQVLLVAGVAGLFATGCAMNCGCDQNQTSPPAATTHAPVPLVPQAPATVIMTAKRTVTPVVVDGKLDDPVWQQAPVYRMFLSRDKGSVPVGGGEVRLAWDQEFFYVGVRFADSDIVQEKDVDQSPFFLSGDLLEVFLKPQDNTWYWEMYATPNNHQTTYFFPGRGRLGLDNDSARPKATLKVAAELEGTLNAWQDVDHGWTAEMAVPRRALTVNGDTFGPGSVWRILVARYNYSRYLQNAELSMSPQLSTSNFHSSTNTPRSPSSSDRVRPRHRLSSLSQSIGGDGSLPLSPGSGTPLLVSGGRFSGAASAGGGGAAPLGLAKRARQTPS